jgi:hypothetical protein
LNVEGTGQELSLPPSLTTPYPGSRPSSSRDPFLHPFAALHSQSLEGQAIQQDNCYISRRMSEQLSYPAFILSNNEDDKTEKGQQQQEVGEDKEQEARNSDTSISGDVNNNNNHQDNDESEGLQPTKERRLSPSCNPAIRRSHKRRLQHVDEGVPTTRSTQQQNHQEIAKEKEQEGHNSNSVGGSRSSSSHDHRDDQDNDDSKSLQPAKRRRPSPSSSDLTSKRSKKQRLQRPHDSCLTCPSKPARTNPVLVQKEPQRPLPLVFDDSDDSEAP